MQWNATSTPNVFYWVEYRFAGTSSWTRMSLPLSTCCTFTAAYLEPRRAYEFRVLATNLAGDGPPSNVAGATTTITPPLAPTGFNVLPHRDGGAVTMGWSPPGGAYPATGYTVQSRLCGHSTWGTIGFVVTGQSFQFSMGGCREYRVIADRYGTLGGPSDVKRAIVPRNDYPYYDWPTWMSDPHGARVRQCTSWVTWRIRQHEVPGFNNWWRQPWYRTWGNAGGWDTSAREAGVRVNTTPAVGSVLQKDGDPGHVAWVIAVHAGTVYAEEYNGSVSLGYSVRAYTNLSGLEFIHFEDFTNW